MRARFTKPYVDALFSVAGSVEAVEAVLPRIETFARTLKSSEELRSVLKNPGIERPRKDAILTAITNREGIDGLANRFLVTLLHNGRLAGLEELIGAIRDRIDREKNVVEALVSAAVPLDAPAAERIQKVLEERTKKSVRVKQLVDPALLGGFVVQIGSEVYDASLARRLSRAREALHTASTREP